MSVPHESRRCGAANGPPFGRSQRGQQGAEVSSWRSCLAVSSSRSCKYNIPDHSCATVWHGAHALREADLCWLIRWADLALQGRKRDVRCCSVAKQRRQLALVLGTSGERPLRSQLFTRMELNTHLPDTDHGISWWPPAPDTGHGVEPDHDRENLAMLAQSLSSAPAGGASAACFHCLPHLLSRFPATCAASPRAMPSYTPKDDGLMASQKLSEYVTGCDTLRARLLRPLQQLAGPRHSRHHVTRGTLAHYETQRL